MSDPVVFVDCETTSLDPMSGEIWDLAIIEANGTEHEWHFRPQRPREIEPAALRVGRIYERSNAPGWEWVHGSKTYEVANQIAVLTENKIFVGVNPWFDAAFLAQFLIANNYREAWDYHMADVGTLALGYLRGRQKRAGRGRSEDLVPPVKLTVVAKALGINIEAERFAKHTAIGDARLAHAIYSEIMDGSHVE